MSIACPTRWFEWLAGGTIAPDTVRPDSLADEVTYFFPPTISSILIQPIQMGDEIDIGAKFFADKLTVGVIFFSLKVGTLRGEGQQAVSKGQVSKMNPDYP